MIVVPGPPEFKPGAGLDGRIDPGRSDDVLLLKVPDFARGKSEDLTVHVRVVLAVTGPVAINDAILEVIALTRTEATNNGVSVRTQLAEGLPPVQGDRVQLQQVVINLVVNGIRAARINEGGLPSDSNTPPVFFDRRRRD